MTDDNVFKLNKPDQDNPLQEVLREGARKMLAAAIEAEVSTFIERHGLLETAEGKSAVAGNGYLPKRSIQTGLGDIEVKVPKIRDRSNSGIKLMSAISHTFGHRKAGCVWQSQQTYFPEKWSVGA